MALSNDVRQVLFVSGKVQEELGECDRVFEHSTHAIKVVAENNKYLTVYARSRETGEKEFEGSVLKKPGQGSAYFFRNAVSLSLLGVHH